MTILAAVLALLVAHPHENLRPRPFWGVSAAWVAPGACQKEFGRALGRIGLSVDSRASERAMADVEVHLVSTKQDTTTLFSVYVIRRGYVGGPHAGGLRPSFVAVWWRNHLLSSEPKRRQCRGFARELAEAIGSSAGSEA